MDNNVGGFAEHGYGIIRNGYTPRRVRPANYVTQVFSSFGRVGINGADNFDGALFAHQPHDRGSDGTDSVLDCTNLLFHVRLRRTPRTFLDQEARLRRGRRFIVTLKNSNV